ncbi:CocE/NonD family hydrolase [Streptomyces sp. NBC_00566]|uniref:CocE/NonD family hydrolase n=1 Tax=Streptomyces sp. NBC_00566 TaxID=2975778 RepID=UPI002E81390B|nr:CocE/NonD family hydrolase [Streptomyces sp. NBC_00566]WUB86009.1 CocE/NonD family hydrolase [Streptomyces sp. NBC_00566]
MSFRKPPLSARLMRKTFRGLPAKRYEVGWEPGLAVPGADGSTLLTDHYFPRGEGDFPTLLVRSPYGRGLPWSPMYGLLFAEQGFHVVLQSCRGTGGSGGAFDLWRNEAADGRATVAWLREQPWFDGTLGTVGPSYLGYVQWALALDPPPELKAMVVQVGLHDPYALFHAGGALRLENALTVGLGMTYQHQGIAPFARAALRLRRHLRAVTMARPLRGAYASALGAEVPWLDEVMAHPDAEDPYWDGASAAPSERLRVPTGLITGWHDALADQTFEQYARLRRAGCETALLVGPWTHASALQRGWPEVFAETLAWLRAHLCADPTALRPTVVRVHMGGENTWRDLDDWPPAADATPWYPTGDGHLTRQAPTGSAPLATFRHDPADPTPALGGPLLSPGAGPRDNRPLEARTDVVTFTGPPLTEPLDIVGPVTADLTLSTDTGHTDVFTRLCDVDAEGRSVNVCDGLGTLTGPAHVPARITVPMSATAHRFAPGHRVRWQISAGAHPRYARNPGTGEPRADTTVFRPIRLTLHTDSALNLPDSANSVPRLAG